MKKLITGLIVAGLSIFILGCDSDSSSPQTNLPNSPDSPSNGGGGSDVWNIPTSLIFDGGPGKDGIPATDNPKFVEDVTRAILDSAKKKFEGCKIRAKTVSQESIHRHDVVAEGSA